MKFNFSALTVWRAILNAENRPKYDINVNYIQIVEEIGTNFYKTY